jgi:hypothetical protein
MDNFKLLLRIIQDSLEWEMRMDMTPRFFVEIGNILCYHPLGVISVSVTTQHREVPMDNAAIANLRRKLIEDEAFRAEFAASPGDALRSLGVDLPAEVTTPPIDKEELDARIEQLKEAAGGDLAMIFDPDVVGAEIAEEGGELSDEALEQVAGGGMFRMMPSRRLRTNSFMNFTRQFSRLRGDMGRIGRGGQVFTLSVCGTADW